MPFSINFFSRSEEILHSPAPESNINFVRTLPPIVALMLKTPFSSIKEIFDSVFLLDFVKYFPFLKKGHQQLHQLLWEFAP